MIVTAAIWLAFVAATVRPPFRRGPLGFAVFLATMVFNELPAMLLAVFAVSVVFSGRPDGVPATVLAAVLVFTTTAGFVWLQVRVRDARGALQAGVRDAGVSAALRNPPWTAGVLVPFQRHNRSVVRRRNVGYGPDRAHRVDIYCSRAAAATRPVLIHFHGGGFVSGGKSRESVALLNQLAADGWLCLSANYRLRGAGQHPNALIDAKRVIAWIRAHADEFGADPSSVFLAGCSAGAHLAVSAALTPGRVELQPGFEDSETSVAGVVAFYGYLGARTADPTSSPANLASPDAPPMLIIHGTHDTAIPVDDARAVAARLGQLSRRPVVFIELPHAQHSFDRFASVRARVASDAAGSFLSWARISADRA